MDSKYPTQAEAAYQALKHDILECRLAPAAKLKISEICETYGVALGAAREALSRLTADGMTRLEPLKGFSVAPVSWEEFEQLMEARAEIEVSCFRKSIREGDVEWETRLAGATHRLARAQGAGRGRDPNGPDQAWLAAHAEFHRALVAACPNQCLLDLRETLYARSERYRHWALSLSARLGERDGNKEHGRLAALAQARDVEAACSAMYEHFMRTARDLLDAVRGAGKPVPDWRPWAGARGDESANGAASGDRAPKKASKARPARLAAR
ncbi:GntR family transcriptional regulator [Roseiarcus fermentans]|uniref:GntR family transcriptional regulator n=1 Tax=Roseiarcus fermentans TaxID=1473586 RepID=A0A366F9N2_9HYPH|nr:GntR family transcriptional regulator [Roseiarcus fermentans]RBP11373.1 GntR family transcriptional regulator [Roseiarcus fermentans]